MMLKLALKLNTVEVHQVTPGGRKMELNGVEVDESTFNCVGMLLMEFTMTRHGSKWHSRNQKAWVWGLQIIHGALYDGCSAEVDGDNNGDDGHRAGFYQMTRNSRKGNKRHAKADSDDEDTTSFIKRSANFDYDDEDDFQEFSDKFIGKAVDLMQQRSAHW